MPFRFVEGRDRNQASPGGNDIRVRDAARWDNALALVPMMVERAAIRFEVSLHLRCHWAVVYIDLDHRLAVELADQFIPETGAVFGRPGKPRSHRLFYSSDVETHQREVAQ